MPKSTQRQIVDMVTLLILILFAVWLDQLSTQSSRQFAGRINFVLGFLLLSAFLNASLFSSWRLPRLTGYICAGLVAGPYISGYLTLEMVQRLRLVDDLALSFIAMTAGGALHLRFLKNCGKAIALNILLQTLVVFGGVFLFFMLTNNLFGLAGELVSSELMALAILLGVTAVARSPSSAIAIISECRASGPFTDTVLGVTIVLDVLIIVFFTVALAASKMLLNSGAGMDYQLFSGLLLEIGFSFLLGALLGKGISVYIVKAGHDLPLFLLVLAFGITKISIWLGQFMESRFAVALHLEPLLICMSAGFIVQNTSRVGSEFMESLERMAMPIFVLFFSLAGASLNLDALVLCWPLALSIVVVRMVGILGATWLAGVINHDPPVHNRVAWMTYITQAGVAIGLAQIAERKFPTIGTYLATIVLAVITINQVVGPITFKIALSLAGETKKN